jgi:hypothetical protein
LPSGLAPREPARAIAAEGFFSRLKKPIHRAILWPRRSARTDFTECFGGTFHAVYSLIA